MPGNYDLGDPENLITKLDIQFEKECTFLQKEGIPNPKGLTVFEFNAKRDFFEKDVKR